jgi:hypothetical protein
LNFLPKLTFHRFIASRIASIFLTLQQKKILTHRSDAVMNSIGNSEKKFIISVVSVAKLKKTSSSLSLHICFALFCGDFCMDLFRVDSDEALNPSLLKF